MERSLKLLPAFRNIFPGDGELKIADVKSFLEKEKDNEEVKKFTATLNPITDDRVNDYFTKDEKGKKYSKTLIDQRVNDAVKTYKTKHDKEILPGLIDAEIKKRFPDESEESKKLKKMTSDIEAMKVESARDKLKAKALEIISEEKLPFAKIVDNLIGKDEAETVERIASLKTIFAEQVTAAVDEHIKQFGRKPRSGEGDPEDEKGEKKRLGKELTELQNAPTAKNLVRRVQIKDRLQTLEKSKTN